MAIDQDLESRNECGPISCRGLVLKSTWKKGPRSWGLWYWRRCQFLCECHQWEVQANWMHQETDISPSFMVLKQGMADEAKLTRVLRAVHALSQWLMLVWCRHLWTPNKNCRRACSTFVSNRNPKTPFWAGGNRPVPSSLMVWFPIQEKKHHIMELLRLHLLGFSAKEALPDVGLHHPRVALHGGGEASSAAEPTGHHGSQHGWTWRAGGCLAGWLR